MISPVSPNLITNSTASLGKAAAATASQEATTAARIAATTPGTAYEDPSSGTVTLSGPSAYWMASVFPENETLQITQAEDAGRSMETIKKELGKIDTMIARRRPELAGSSWDFKLVDGKLKVTGVNEDDAKWLERKLNSSSALLGAAKSFMSKAVANLETTDLNPARLDFNYATGNQENYTFYKVKDQLTEKLAFRSLLEQSDRVYDSAKIELTAGTRGASGLAVAATLLKASNPPIEGPAGAFYPIKYDPLGG